MAFFYSLCFLFLLGVPAGADNIDHVQIAVKSAQAASCEVTIYEHSHTSVNSDYTGDTEKFLGTGHHPVQGLFGASAVEVKGQGCMAYGYTSADCSGEKSGNGVSSTTQVAGLAAGIVSSSDELVKYWGCNDCIRCVQVEQGDATPVPTAATPAPTAVTPAPTAATPAPTPPQETPKCDGCGANMDCFTKCGKAGYCDICNSVQGTKGACCKVEESNGVRTRPTKDNPAVCQDIPAANFKYTNYHACILNLQSPHEFPKCTGCGTNMECWSTCNSKAGYCEACNSAQGTKGACCRVDADGSYAQGSPAECLAVPTSGFAYRGYNMCVLDVEIPKCIGCTSPPLSCWNACEKKSGDCRACDGSNRTAGACCRMDNGEHSSDATQECKAIPVSRFSYWGYNICVLQEV